MTRFLAIVLLAAFVTACSSPHDSATEGSNADSELNPTAMSLDTPPTSGNLPTDLRPPA